MSHANEKIVFPKERSGFALAIKRFVQAGFFALILPRLALYYIGQGIVGDQAFSSASESIAKKTGNWGVFMRQAFYRKLLLTCGSDVYIGWGTVFSMREASLGNRVFIGRNCNIGFGCIGDDVMLADSVIVLSGGREHSMDVCAGVMHDQKQVFRKTTIGAGTWIGAGSTIMADVGKECIVGAGAVVNKPIPDGAVAVGVPARVVKFRPGYGGLSELG